MNKHENLDNEKKELVKYWIDKLFKSYDTPILESESITFIEKHLSPTPVLMPKKWYWYNDCLLCYQSTREDKVIRAYGFLYSGIWQNESNFGDVPKQWKEATPEEYEPRLIELAKSKGYRLGNFKCLRFPPLTIIDAKSDIFVEDGNVWMGEKTRANCIMHNGKWAEIIDTKAEIRESVARLEAELQTLKSQL